MRWSEHRPTTSIRSWAIPDFSSALSDDVVANRLTAEIPGAFQPNQFENPDDLLLQTFVNGDKRQEARTSSLIFNVPVLVAFLSHITSLRTGDVIFTGTPEGVGNARKPPVFLRPGDEITIAIDQIGQLTNPVLTED